MITRVGTFILYSNLIFLKMSQKSPVINRRRKKYTPETKRHRFLGYSSYRVVFSGVSLSTVGRLKPTRHLESVTDQRRLP